MSEPNGHLMARLERIESTLSDQNTALTEILVEVKANQAVAKRDAKWWGVLGTILATVFSALVSWFRPNP